MTAFALESAGIQEERFLQAKAKSIQRTLYFKIERTAVLSALEKSKIWYMPLKGIIISELYPKVSMREMADNDILFDSSRIDDIKQIMFDHGFYMEHDDSGHDLAFMKKPVCNFEMHTQLFGIGHDEYMNRYYSNVKTRLCKDSDNENGYHFSNEDFYIFMMAHEYKHFNNEGTGILSLVDSYVYLNKHCDDLDWKYINRELNILEIDKYENISKELSVKLFNGEQLTKKEKALLEYYIFSGTYGDGNSKIRSTKKNYNEHFLRYIFNRTFLSQSKIRRYYPFFYKYKFLQPF